MMLGLRGRTGAHALGQPGGAFSGLTDAVKTLLAARERRIDNDADRAERRGLLREKIDAELAAKQAEPPPLAPSYLLRHAGRQYVEEERPMYDALGSVVVGDDGKPVMESKSFYRPREDEERTRILIRAGFDPQTMRQIDPARQQQLLQQLEATAAVGDGISDEERQRFANRKAALEQRAALAQPSPPVEEGPSNAAEFMQAMPPAQPQPPQPPAPVQDPDQAPATPAPEPTQDAAPSTSSEFMQSLPPAPPWSTGERSPLLDTPPQLGGADATAAAPTDGGIDVGGQTVPVPPEAAAVIRQPEFASRIERARRVGRADIVQAIIERAMHAR